MTMRLPEFIKTKWFWYGLLVLLAVPYTILCLNTPVFQDYKYCLYPWVDYIRTHGGWKSIADLYSNYPALYLYFLTAISYLPFEPLLPIRLFSILFSLIGGWFLGKIVYLRYRESWIKPAVLAISMAIPTVAINGAYWAQCDSIYTTFIIISLYYLIIRRNNLSIVYLGLAFSLKLQAIFIFPVYVIFLLRRELRWWHPIVAIATWVATWIPALIIGHPVNHIWMLYGWQANEGHSLVVSFINIWNFFPSSIHYNHIATIISLSIIGAFALWIFYKTRNKILSPGFTVAIATTTIALVLLLLPKMHERYMYLADVLAIAYIFYFPKMWLPAISLPIISLFCYFRFYCVYSHRHYLPGQSLDHTIVLIVAVAFVAAVSAMIIYLVKVQIPKLKPSKN